MLPKLSKFSIHIPYSQQYLKILNHQITLPGKPSPTTQVDLIMLRFHFIMDVQWMSTKSGSLQKALPFWFPSHSTQIKKTGWFTLEDACILYSTPVDGKGASRQIDIVKQGLRKTSNHPMKRKIHHAKKPHCHYKRGNFQFDEKADSKSSTPYYDIGQHKGVTTEHTKSQHQNIMSHLDHI